VASIDVSYVANLARLDLNPAEVESFQKQLSDVLEYMEQLKAIDVSKADQQSLKELVPQNRLRKDEIKPSLERDAALSNAPARASEHLISVPKIVES
jgi:aspartyl-tRNA(Asn)/glutamyl-tRNA(Gln) amidotransferase subunit C